MAVLFSQPRLRTDLGDDGEFSKKLKQYYIDAKENERKIKAKQFRSIKDRYKPPQRRSGAFVFDGKKCRGDQLLDMIYKMLDKLYRSPQQKQFHQSFLASFLRIIYGEDYDKEKHRVCCKYGFESRKQQVLVCAPRRMGKTWSVAYLVVVTAIVLSGVEISIFSPGKRQSVALMNHIYNFVKKLGETDRVIKRNEEKMIMRSIDGKESIINAYPSAVKTLKGVSGTIVILEEMAVIDPRVLFEVVVPLLQIDITSLIGISTITDEYNFMTKYLEKKDKNGEPLFAVHRIYLACKRCREAGLAAQCNHNAYLLPQWSSPRKRKIINCIMEDQEDLLNREIGGIENALHEKAFPPSFIKDLEERTPYIAKDSIYYPQIFIAIDPNGAGKSSDFAITSMVRINGTFVIIGMESFASKSAQENHGLIIRHLSKLESLSMFRNSLKVFILESNLGLESEHIKSMLERQGVRNYLVMSEQEGEGAKVGFRTTNAMKTQAVEMFREKLIDGSMNIIDSRQLVCVSNDAKRIRNVLFSQMRDFAEILKEHDIEKPKKYWSGKGAGKDDLIITVLLCVYWSRFFYKRYVNHVKR
jgi:hypothetical protein